MSINQNILLAGQNYVDDAVITGGATESGYPLSYLQTMEMWQFMRFASVVSANTYLVLEFSETKILQLFAALKHSLSPVGKWRIRVGTTQSDVTGAPLYDSGWVKITPSFSGYGALPWGEWNWGEVLPAEYSNILNRNGWHIAPDPVYGKVVRIDFDDALENEFGYLQMARLWLGSIYQPSVNVPYGAKIIPIEKTKVREAESGVRFYGTRYLRRALSMSFDLPIKELLYYIFGPLYAVNGRAGEVVAILQPLDPETFLFEAVYGNLRDMPEVTHISWDRLGSDLFIDERV